MHRRRSTPRSPACDSHVRTNGYGIAFETIFGLPDQRLTIRHDAGVEPYVGGTLLAAQRVMGITGLVRGPITCCSRLE